MLFFSDVGLAQELPVQAEVAISEELDGSYLYDFEIVVKFGGFPEELTFLVVGDVPPGAPAALIDPALVGPAPLPFSGLGEATGSHNGTNLAPTGVPWEPTAIGDKLVFSIRASNANCDLRWSQVAGGIPRPTFERVNLVNSDADDDGVCDVLDICQDVANPLHEDSDSDGAGDKCDNCPTQPNPDQADVDNNGVGDACDNSTIAIDPGTEPVDMSKSTAGCTSGGNSASSYTIFLIAFLAYIRLRFVKP